MATNDQEMVNRFLRGDSEAVGTVDSWISRAAWPYQRRLADRWDDVLQDVRLEVTRLLGQGKFRGESSLRTYLWRVVSHTCLDQLRAQKKWKWADLEELDQGNGPDPVPAGATRHADRSLLQGDEPPPQRRRGDATGTGPALPGTGHQPAGRAAGERSGIQP